MMMQQQNSTYTLAQLLILIILKLKFIAELFALPKIQLVHQPKNAYKLREQSHHRTTS